MRNNFNVDREISELCFIFLRFWPTTFAVIAAQGVISAGHLGREDATYIAALGAAWLVAPLLRLPRGTHQRERGAQGPRSARRE